MKWGSTSLSITNSLRTVAKSSSKTPVAPPEDNVSHLDEKLYNFSVKTAKGILRFRITVLSILGLAVVGIFSMWGLETYRIQQKRAISARLAALLKPPTVGKDVNVAAILPDLEELVDSARGTNSQKWVVKSTVGLLIESARKKIYPDKAATVSSVGGDTDSVDVDVLPASPAAGGRGDEPPLDKEMGPAALLDKAMGLVTRTRKEFTDDPDIVHWADESLRAIQSLRDRENPADKFSQKPILPPPPGASSSPAAPPPSPPPASPPAPGGEK